MRELQRRLAAAGFLAPGSAEDSNFCARTHAAVIAFQEQFGLRADGVVDDTMWSVLIEASWTLGDRILYLRSPNLRGEDVAELQASLNRIGFDCGRVDGIFGPSTRAALTEFQRNIGLAENGIATPDAVSVLSQVSSQTGSGPGIALVREREEMGDSTPEVTARIVIGGFDGVADLVRATQLRAHEVFPLATSVQSDSLTQAQTANTYGAHVYVGYESSGDDTCTIHFYEVPAFHSVGGKALAERIAAAINETIPELSAHTAGVRHPVLRETRMPAVLCTMGPTTLVHLKTGAVSRAVVASVRDWLADPLEA